MTGDGSPDPNQRPREPLSWRLRRVAGAQLIVLAVLFGLAFLHFSARRSTSPTLEGVVPQDAHLVTQQVLTGGVHALLVEHGDAFQLLMAYEVRDGWVALPAFPQRSAEYAVAASAGRAPVPAFTAVYGRLAGSPPGGEAKVRISWTDGPQDVPLVDGGFLSVREGRFGVGRVSLTGAGGAIVRDLAR